MYENDNRAPLNDELDGGGATVETVQGEDGTYYPETEEETADREQSESDDFWLSRAQQCHADSANWFDAAIRNRVENAWRRFRSQHEAGSKYYTDFYAKRSQLFPPRTREGLRKIEAAVAAAFFATDDAVHCSAVNDADEDQRDSAAVHNALLYYRLSAQAQMRRGGIPWFLTLMGGSQDAMTTGIVVSRQNWEFDQRTREYLQTYEDGTQGIIEEQEIIRDEPAVTLVAIENFGISPAADWTDPINSSPFTWERIPMLAQEVVRRMVAVNPYTGRTEYRPRELGVIVAACKEDWDSIQLAREGNTVDKYDAIDYQPYQTVWVHRHIQRQADGSDVVFDTLGNYLMLSWEPRPLEEVYLHGIRPYALGYSVAEAHNVFPEGVNDLVRQLQHQFTELENAKLDAIKQAVNPRWKVRRGGGVDTRALMRNVPSGLVHMNDINKDVDQLASRDIGQSPFAEGDRLSLAMDGMLGNMSQTTIGSTRSLGDTVGGMNLLSADANESKEYTLRTLSETWIEQVVRQLVLLEATYETDDFAVKVAADRTQLTPERVHQILRLQEPVCVAISVGFGATSPIRRLERLNSAIKTLNEVRPDIVQQIDARELGREVFGILGYRDGARFLPTLMSRQKDPVVAQLEQKVQQLQSALDNEMAKEQGKIQVAQLNAQSRERIAMIAQQTALTVKQYEGQGQMQIAAMKHRLDELDRMLQAEKNDHDRGQLQLEREALSADIMDKERNFRLKMHQQHKADSQQDFENAGAGEDGPMNLPGNDKAGTLARSNYGSMPESISSEGA